MLSLDFSTYRFYEKIAKSQLPNWRIQALFNLDVFQKTGFPIRIESNLELRTIIDTMQEERFDVIQEELAGLTSEEYERYLNALEENIRLQMMMYPHLEPLPPFDAMLHSLLVNIRLEALKPDFKKILEIGPGCGYNSFYLKENKNLENYSVTDACESFYLLQNHVNQFCFKENFEQLVPISIEYNGPKVNTKLGLSDITLTQIDDHECKIENRNTKKCTHFPWWQLGNIYENENRYDIITSNSNLLEFTKGALVYYLDFISKKLDKNGYFVVIGSGYYATQEEFDELGEFIYKAGLAPLVLLQGTADTYDLDSINDWIRDDEKVILAPFSEKMRRFYSEFAKDIFSSKEVIFMDDNVKEHEDFQECRFLTFEEVKKEKISSKVIIGTTTDQLRDRLFESFAKINLETICIDDKILKKQRFCMWNAVFVNKEHSLHKKYYSMANIRKTYFIADEINYEATYIRANSSDKIFFTKNDVKVDLKKRFDS